MSKIGEMVECLDKGGYAFREGWKGKGQVLWLQNPDENSKMTESYIYMEITRGGKVFRIPWLCSQSDLLAQDWVCMCRAPWVMRREGSA